MQTQMITVTLHSKDKPIKSIEPQPKPVHKTILYLVLLFITKLALAVGAMAVSAKEIVPLAYAERGYYAIGGEWLIVGLVGMTVWFGVGYLVKEDKQ